jgi:hypothetical protein
MIKVDNELIEKIIKRIENELKYKKENISDKIVILEMDLDSFFFIGEYKKEILGYLPFIIEEIESVFFKNDKIIIIINKE